MSLSIGWICCLANCDLCTQFRAVSNKKKILNTNYLGLCALGGKKDLAGFDSCCLVLLVQLGCWMDGDNASRHGKGGDRACEGFGYG